MFQQQILLKYTGRISPIHLHKLPNPEKGLGKSVVRDEVFECPADYAAELMAHYNEKNLEPKFIVATNEKVGAPQGRGRPPKDKELIDVGMIK